MRDNDTIFQRASTTRVPIPIGTLVKVNCYHAIVTRIITAFAHRDSFRGSDSPLQLLNPLYEVELDFSRKFSWNEKRVGIPPDCKRLKLFADEFEVLEDWAMPKALKNTPAYLEWLARAAPAPPLPTPPVGPR